MATTVYAIELELRDHGAPVVADATIGLFNRTEDLFSNASSGQKDVILDTGEGATFKAGDLVTISDTAPGTEINIIDSIAGDTLTMVNDLVNTYTTANSAKVDANSVFRWLQNSIVGVTGWASGVIIENGIGRWKRSIDLSRSGNIAEPGKASVAVKNSNRFYDILDTKGIVINGTTFRIFEFSDTTPTQRWTGFCQKPDWDSFSYRIPAQGGHNRRRSNLTTLNTEAEAPATTKSKPIPVMFGKIEKAKMIRVVKKTKTLLNTAGDMGLTAGGDPQGLKLFQVISGSDVSYEIRIFKDGNDNSGNLAAIDTALTDKFIQITEGANEVGVIRRITNVSAYTDANHSITIDINSHFKDDLSISGDTWIKILEIDRVYQNDTFPLKSFLDSDLNEISDPLELYAFDDDNNEFTQIPHHSLSTLVGANNNKIDAQSEFFEKNPDTLNSFIIKPVDNVQLTPDLSENGANQEWPGIPAAFKIQDGFYKSTNTAATITNISTGTILNITDRDGTSVFNATYKNSNIAQNGVSLQMALDFTMPDYPEGFTADAIFFMVLSDWDETIIAGSGGKGTAISTKRVFGGLVTRFFRIDWATTGKLELKNFPDFYFTTNIPSTFNQFFYKDDSNTLLTSGFLTIPIIPDGDQDKYENFAPNRGLIVFSRTIAAGPAAEIDEDVNINAMAVLFQKNLDIKDAIFSGVSGRIFNDTWGSRKTAADLMESPIDFLEHICRLQNWTETSFMPTDGWGKNYPAKPFIKTAGDGSFDATDPEFTVVKNFNAARQVITQQSGFTDRLKRSLCKNFFLANWIDATGNECVKRIIKTNQTGLDTVTLNDITNRASIRIREANPANIFPELFVLFDFDQGTGSFTNAIRISNVDADNPTPTEKQDFIEGMVGSKAEEVWDRANALWKKTLRLNKPPSDLTELLWAIGPDSQAIAEDYIVNLIDWADNVFIQFQLPKEKCKTWEETHRFELTLIHQTNSIAIECLLTSIEFDPNPPFHATIQAIMFKTPLPAEFSLVDQLGAIGGDSDWIDKLDAIGGDSDKIDQL